MNKGKLVVYLGGVRSGKSEAAEARVQAFRGQGKVAYVATALPPAKGRDKDLEKRLQAHRDRRPASWETWEGWETLLVCLKKAARSPYKALLVDGLGMYASRGLNRPPEAFLDDIEVFAKGCRNQVPLTVVVADEVGLGGVAAHAMARRFADLNGKANQVLARHADEVWMVAAGIPVRIK